MKKAIMTAILLSGIAAASAANANIYVNGSVGQASKATEGAIKAETLKAKRKMYTLGVGYNINEYFGVEGRIAGFEGRGDANKDNINYYSMGGVYGKAQLPISDAFSAYGLLGASSVEHFSYSKGKRTNAGSVSGGVGVQYNLTNNFGINLEYMNYSSNESAELSNLALGAQYRF